MKACRVSTFSGAVLMAVKEKIPFHRKTEDQEAHYYLKNKCFFWKRVERMKKRHFFFCFECVRVQI
jgi:hypothetical protein